MRFAFVCLIVAVCLVNLGGCAHKKLMSSCQEIGPNAAGKMLYDCDDL